MCQFRILPSTFPFLSFPPGESVSFHSPERRLLSPTRLQLAVITQGIAARVAQGNASSAKAAQQAKIMPIMGDLAANHIRDYADVGAQTKL